MLLSYEKLWFLLWKNKGTEKNITYQQIYKKKMCLVLNYTQVRKLERYATFLGTQMSAYSTKLVNKKSEQLGLQKELGTILKVYFLKPSIPLAVGNTENQI